MMPTAPLGPHVGTQSQRSRAGGERFPTVLDVPALPEPPSPVSDGTVALRRFTFDDVLEVTTACQDPEIPRWTASIPEPYEEHHARGWIARHDTAWAEGTDASFAFCSVPTGELLGSMALGDIDLDHRSAAAGYWAAPWARNRGATTRALRLACRWGFDALDLEIVNVMTLLGNQASERVAEKAGFRLVRQVYDFKPSRALDPGALYQVKHWVLERG
jgi:RimJ/RimL family protein N-acetyltransferase